MRALSGEEVFLRLYSHCTKPQRMNWQKPLKIETGEMKTKRLAEFKDKAEAFVTSTIPLLLNNQKTVLNKNLTRMLKYCSMVGFIYTFWYSLLSTISILE